MAIKKNSQHILIIKNVNIDDEHQGQGFGTQIISELLDNDFDTAILIADIKESQQDGFLLENFYNNLGFDSVLKQDQYPIMIYPKQKAKLIKNDIFPKNKKKNKN
jgi:GNAT superfamily N-acetyltransferase